MKPTVTELALTLGRWGVTPLNEATQKKVVETLVGWSVRTRTPLRIESYMDAPVDRNTLQVLVERAHKSDTVTAVARIEPRSDRWKILHEMGVREAVFEVPVSDEAARARFTPLGSDRSPGFAAEMARDAMVHGVTPEIALVDICRAKEETVSELIAAVQREAVARSVECRWRLVDDTGLGNPLPGSKTPRSLARWIRWMEREFSIASSSISVQASDLRGLALANALAGVQEKTGAATSLFGLGIRAGWAATEVLMLHLGERGAGIPELMELHGLLGTEDVRDSFRPVSGRHVWQMLGGTTPENLSSKWDAQLACDPKQLTGIEPEPLLTSLSGHAGLLHLMHENMGNRQFDSDDQTTLKISSKIEAEYASGRQQPVGWYEIEPLIRATSLWEEDPASESADANSKNTESSAEDPDIYG